MSLVLVNAADAEAFARSVANSALIPQAYRGKPADIIVAVQMGHELGLKPTVALRSIAVINGKPALYGDAALAVVMASGKLAAIRETVEGEGEAMVASCYVRRTVPEIERTVYFTGADARHAGLLGKSGPWQQFPARMMQMRARAFALRDVFPDLLSGNLAEEFEGVEQAAAPMRDVSPKPVAVEPRVELVEWVDQHGETRVTTAADQAREMLDVVASGTPEEIAEMVGANPKLPHAVAEVIDTMIKVYIPSMAEPHSYCPTPRAAWSKLLELEPKHGRQNLAALNLPLIESLLDDKRAKPETRALLREWLDAGETALNAEAAE